MSIRSPWALIDDTSASPSNAKPTPRESKPTSCGGEAPANADRALAPEAFHAVRVAVLIEHRRLSDVAKEYGTTAETIARTCSSETRFLGRWPDGISSVPTLAIVRAQG